jgi:hypothetical protein
VDTHPWPAHAAPGGRLELPTMPGAYEAIPVHEAVGERPPVVRAGVGHDVGAPVLEHDHGDVVSPAPSGHHLASAAPRQGLGHRRARMDGCVGIAAEEIADEGVGAGLSHGPRVPSGSDSPDRRA